MATIRAEFFSLITEELLFSVIPLDLSIEWGLNEAPSWDMDVRLETIDLTQLNRDVAIRMYVNGQLVLTGVLTSVDQKNSDDQISVSLKGSQIVDLLNDVRASSQSFYDHSQIIGIIEHLLRSAGYRLNDISTAKDMLRKRQLDLRTESRLFSQVQKVIEEVPELYYRVTEDTLFGDRTIDIGFFNNASDLQLVSGTAPRPSSNSRTGAITDLSIKYETTNVIKRIEAIGGETVDNNGVTRNILLGDALAFDPLLATDPNFPIITEIADYVYYVENAALSSGAETTEFFTSYAPDGATESSPASAGKVRQAGLSLYYRAIAYLLDHQANDLNIKIDAIGNNIFVFPGEKVRVFAVFPSTYTDMYSGDTITNKVLIDDSYRCNKVQMRVNDDQIEWTYELTSGLGISLGDRFMAVLDRTRKRDKLTGKVLSEIAPVSERVEQTFGPNLSPNKFYSNGNTARRVLIFPTTLTPPGSETNLWVVGRPFDTTVRSNSVKVNEILEPNYQPNAESWTVQNFNGVPYYTTLFDTDTAATIDLAQIPNNGDADNANDSAIYTLTFDTYISETLKFFVSHARFAEICIKDISSGVTKLVYSASSANTDATFTFGVDAEKSYEITFRTHETTAAANPIKLEWESDSFTRRLVRPLDEELCAIYEVSINNKWSTASTVNLTTYFTWV